MSLLGSLSNDNDDVEDNALYKMNLYFTSDITDCLDLFGTPMALRTCYSYICNDGVAFCLATFSLPSSSWFA